MFDSFFQKLCHLWDNVEKFDSAGQATDDSVVWCMRFARWLTKATDTHSLYVILIAFPRQHGYMDTPQCYIYMYIACLVEHGSFIIIHPLGHPLTVW
jgi:hypothetical protein